MGMPNFDSRTIYRHDNLPVMQGMNSETIDLIATDPPFNKNREFYAPTEDLVLPEDVATLPEFAKGAKFDDRWRWENDVHQEWIDNIKDDHPEVWSVIEAAKVASGGDMAAFCCFMAVRLIEMRRLLKPTGSIYLHCDHTASHYLRSVMDAVFGRKNFRNEIVWSYRRWSGKAKRFQRMHDTILFYSRSESIVWNTPMEPKASGTPKYRRWNEIDPVTGKMVTKSDKTTLVTETLMRDVWEISRLQSSAKESRGYKTQKPLSLYKRIISASSNPGDIVLDPFAGCATTPVAAEMLGRLWVGIDKWPGVYEMVLSRLDDEVSFMGGRAAVYYSPDPPVRTDTGEVGAVGFDTPDSQVPFLRPAWQRLTNPVMRWILGKAQSQQDGFGVCAGCGRRVPVEYMELDHIQPKSDKGRNYITNRILICATCNRQKGNKRTLDGLRADIKKSGWLEDLNAAKFSREKAFEVAEMVESQWDTPEVQAIVGEAKAAVAEQKRK